MKLVIALMLLFTVACTGPVGRYQLYDLNGKEGEVWRLDTTTGQVCQMFIATNARREDPATAVWRGV